jgi:peptidoglycan/LPS O-acetylase OafA/YrhL
VSGIAIVGLFSPTYVGATVQYGLPRGLAGFFTGVLVYHLRRGWRPRVGTGVEILTMGAVILFVSWAGAASWAPLFTPLVFGIVVFVFASESGALSALLSTRFALALGAWSYSIYMVHMLVISAFKVVASQSNMFATHIEGTTTLFRARWPWVADLLLLLYLAIVVAVSAITFRLIEVPAREFFNGIVGHQTKPKVLSPIAG